MADFMQEEEILFIFVPFFGFWGFADSNKTADPTSAIRPLTVRPYTTNFTKFTRGHQVKATIQPSR